jgi:signal transduction histidine kinase
MDWAMGRDEPAIVPEETIDEGIHAVLLLPLTGVTGSVGVLVLWVDFDPAEFTQEQANLLNLLGHRAATVVETLRFRGRLFEANARMEDIVESVPHGIMGLSPEGEIHLLNGTMEFMLNVRRDEILGRPYAEALPEPVADAIRATVSGAVMEERELTLNLRGEEEVFGLAATPLRAAGDNEAGGVVVLCRDLKLTREVVKLRELDAMKNDFLSLVSHELRTPLTSILAYAETLLMDGLVETEEERQEYLQIIYDEGHRLSRLINDVLDLTKMEAGKMEYIFAEIDLNALAHTAVQGARSIGEPKGLDYREDFDPELPPVRADADRIQQVLTNLLSNATKFTESGSITVETRRSPPLEEQTVETATVRVSDTGIGIAPADLDRVFAKFEQVESIDHHSIGTGLGMPICKQIIEDGHGGRIGIESEVGRGTTVWFRIPLL